MVESAPSEAPAVDSLATEAAGDHHYYITRFDTMQHEKAHRRKNMSREEMIEYITERLEAADNVKLEQYYWFFQFEEE